jgi:hypothetical protein
MHLTTVSEEVLGLRGTARITRVSKVICAPDDIVVRGAFIISGKVLVYEICVEHNKCGSNPFGYGNRDQGRRKIVFHEIGRTGTLGRFDVRKRYTLGFHLFPIDSFLMVRDIYALWPPQAHRQLACNRSSSSESRERSEEKSELHAVQLWFCVDSYVWRAIYLGQRM